MASFGQKKQPKSIEQRAKEWILNFAKMNPMQKMQASKELVYFLNNTDGYTKGLWLASMQKYAPKEDEATKQKRLKAEEDKKQSEQAAREEEKVKNEEEEREEERISNYEKSDYANIVRKISGRLNNWLIRTEFEKTEDYNKRLQSLNSVFDTICNDEITTLIKSQNNSQRLVTEMLGYGSEIIPFYRSISGSENISLDFEAYNADKEFYPLNIQYKDLKFTTSLQMPIDKAKKIWSEIERYDDSNSGYSDKVLKWRELKVEYPQNINDWTIADYNLSPTKVILNFGDKDHSMYEVKLPLIEAKRITISSADLELNNYNGTPLTFELDSYLKNLNHEKIQTLIKNGEECERKNKLLDALIAYRSALELDSSSAEINTKITDITNQINRSRLVSEGNEFFKKGFLSKSRQKYEDANKIKITAEVTDIISSIDKTIAETTQKHTDLETKYATLLNSTLLNFERTFGTLEDFKKGYGLKYKDCILKINEGLQTKRLGLNQEYSVYINGLNLEKWTVRDQELLNKVNSFSMEIKSFDIFEGNLTKALQNKDKKFLKILKEDDHKVIIDTVMKTNYTASLD